MQVFWFFFKCHITCASVYRCKSYLQWWNFSNFLEPNVEASKIKFQILFIDWFYWLSMLVYKSNNPILLCNVILVSISIHRPWRRSMKPLKVILLPTKIEWNKLLLLHRNLSKFDFISILAGGGQNKVFYKKKMYLLEMNYCTVLCLNLYILRK